MKKIVACVLIVLLPSASFAAGDFCKVQASDGFERFDLEVPSEASVADLPIEFGATTLRSFMRYEFHPRPSEVVRFDVKNRSKFTDTCTNNPDGMTFKCSRIYHLSGDVVIQGEKKLTIPVLAVCQSEFENLGRLDD